ncbi:MAG: DUF4249 domain-containing protein [Taibaiella sp.]|nr:DUF4249 domain-containing protein [Taibaiella sp.]
MCFNKVFYTIAATALLLFTACEKTVKLNVPPHTPLLVLNATINVGDTLFAAISRTESITGGVNSGQIFPVTGATVDLYTNGVLTETMTYRESAGVYASHVVAEVGKEYTIKAAASGYTSISATTKAVSTVAVTATSLTRNARKDQDGNFQDMVTISFTEPATEGDFYVLKIARAQTFLNTQGQSYERFCVNTNDGSIETVNNDYVDVNTCVDNDGIYLRDLLFNGQKKEMKLYVPSHFSEPVVVGSDTFYYFIQLNHVTEAGFRYEKSLRAASNSNGDPFAEPANVYTNVTNGYGIFAISSYSVEGVK